MKIRPVGAKLVHAGGQTGMTKLKFLFAILQTRPKINKVLHNVSPTKPKFTKNC
jgi:hypothetical protein